MNMKQSCKALICAIEGELDGRHCTEEQAAAILDHALPSLTEALARAEAKLAQAADLLRGVTNQPFINSNLVKAIDLFLAIQAQAEQQAVDLPQPKDPSEYRGSSSLYAKGWKDCLAALATQPATGEPVAWRYPWRGGKLYTESRDSIPHDYPCEPLYAAPPAAAHGESASEQHRNDMADTIISLRTEVAALRRNAAAHGDEAVRKDAERFDWLISNVCMGSVGFGDWWMNADEPASEWRAAIDAAMRAQAGKGES